MARTNHSYVKRQKEIARKKKQEAKRLKKLAKNGDRLDDGEQLLEPEEPNKPIEP